MATQEKGSDEPEFHISGRGSKKFQGLIPLICSIGSHDNQDYFLSCKPKGENEAVNIKVCCGMQMLLASRKNIALVT